MFFTLDTLTLVRLLFDTGVLRRWIWANHSSLLWSRISSP
jgi:hypothetical protein